MGKVRVVVGMGSCGIAAGAGKVYDKIVALKEAEHLDFELSKTSCIGMCFREPLVEIVDSNGHYLYGEIDEAKAIELLDRHVVNGEVIPDYIVHSDFITTPDDNFFRGQVKIALRNCGKIDPESIDEAIVSGAYKAIAKIGKEHLTPEEVVREVSDSGISGRGGGGFPTGMKWRLAAGSRAEKKYIICNADEGDPGAFMDRSLLEGDPHSVIEGMIIAGYAIGASEGIIYCRAEYPLALQRIEIAIEQARKRDFLGEDIAGIQGFSFDITVKEGAGAFVCGEETALIASIEGKRGMPVKRPPYPSEAGLWGKPTNINNVETYADIPWIILNGASSYSVFGTEKSKGTKVFALAGKIKNSGLIEVPIGTTINEIIFNLGGGIKDGGEFKAVQLGGPSGGCIPAYLGDTKVDYDSIKATGAIMGSGGMVVMDQNTCMVDIARFFLDFTQKESCGKCTFCRIGTKRMLEILERICRGEGSPEDIDYLLELSEQIQNNSLCGLGQSAPNPVVSTIKYFRDEYEAHVNQKRCPAKVCKKLLTYEVIPEKCTGCMVCKVKCPVNAITGERKGVHFIHQELCTKCGECYTRCKFDAIKIY